MVFARLNQQMERVARAGMRASAIGVPLVLGTFAPFLWNVAIGAIRLPPSAAAVPIPLVVVVAMVVHSSVALIGSWMAARRGRREAVPFGIAAIAALFVLPIVGVLRGSDGLVAAMLAAGLTMTASVALERLRRPDRTPAIAWLVVTGALLIATHRLAESHTATAFWRGAGCSAVGAAAAAAVASFSPFALSTGPAARSVISLWIGTAGAMAIVVASPATSPDLATDRLYAGLAAAVLAVGFGLAWRDGRAIVRQRAAIRAAALAPRPAPADASANP
jgi:hypothetical protein